MAAPLAPDGVIAESPAVALTSGLTFSVPDGFEGRVKGYHYRSSGATTRTATANSNSLPRRDRLVLRLDRATKAVTTVIKQGTPSSGLPPLPSLTQTTTGVYEIPICHATCPGNASAQNYHTLVQEYTPVSSTRGVHSWTGSGTVDSTGLTVPLTVTSTSGIASLSGGTSVLLNRPGIWSIWGKAYSNGGTAGMSRVWLEWVGGPSDGLDTDSRWRGEGFAGAGELDQQVRFCGLVTPVQATLPIQLKALYRANSAGVGYEFGLYAHYLGG